MWATTLKLDITWADIKKAQEESDRIEAGRIHTWYNPVAIALERQLGSQHWVAVTENFIHIARGDGWNVRLPVDRHVKEFMDGWYKDRAAPSSINLSIA